MTPEEIIYNCIYKNEPITEKQLIKETGFSSITILNNLKNLLDQEYITKFEEDGKIYYATNLSYSLSKDLANLSDEEFYKKLKEYGHVPGSVDYKILEYFHNREKE